MKRHTPLLLAALVAAFSLTGTPQAQGQEIAYTDLSCQNILQAHQLDTAEVCDTTAFRLRFENMKEPYAQRIEACRQTAKQIGDALQQMVQTGTVRDGYLWVDSVARYVDYSRVSERMTACLGAVRQLLERFENLERQRLEQERRIAEEKARQEAQKRQDALDQQWNALRDQVADQHAQIGSICSANGVSDKSRRKALSDLHFDYLPIYNRFDLSAAHGDEQNIERVEHLCRFQRHLLDSVLGPAGYPARIDNFATALKTRAGKNHSDVYKSYTKVIKTITVPYSFGKLDEYRTFVRKLIDIEAVQQGYLTTIDLREEIANNSVAIRNKCGKHHKDVLEAYLAVVDGVKQVPTFATVGEKEMFLESLRDFVAVQQSYLIAVERLDAIQLRADSLLSLCAKPITDVAASYRALATNTSFIPTFNTHAGAQFFLSSLDDFEQLQNDYIYTIDLRQTIARNDAAILKHKSAPKAVLSHYKECKNRIVLVPSFNTHEKALNYHRLLEEHIALQEKHLEAERQSLEILNNSQAVKTKAKGLSNIVKAYGILLKNSQTDISVRSENDLTRMLSNQRALIAVQQRLLEMLNGADCGILNSKLKGVKSAEDIKSLLGIN